MRHALPTGIAILAFSIAASAQTPAGGEFRINTYTTRNQFRFRPAMAPDGDFVIVWSSGGGQDGSGYGAFGQRFSASGAIRGSEFLINTYTTGRQINPSAAVGGRGDFVVVWEGVADGSTYSIQGQRFDGAGSAVGGEFLVNTFTTGRQYNPRIGQAADGRFVVAWTSDIIDGDRSGIVARRFDTSGIPIGADFLVNTYTTGVQGSFDVAVEANGNFVAVWQDDVANNRDGAGSGIFGQRFDAAGNRLGSEFQVNSYTPPIFQQYPSVSISPAGGFVVAWSNEFGDGAAFGAFARRFDGSGNAVGSDFVVNTYTTGDQGGGPGVAQVAHDARGNFVVTWRGYLQSGSGWDSFAQRFSASGARQLSSAVASDSSGNFVVAWQSGHDGSGYGVFAQRFGGLGPAALAVDSTGNQVLEPGETVDVRPTWRNFNGAAQTFSGTLANITGPVGATHTVTDGAGNYGTVANGATGPCIECYTVAVSNPATRPAVHWDASAVESIVPDTQGQQKQWLLHVGRSFADVPATNPFYRFIETLLHHGVTGGCSGTQYCPASSTTRDQMAVFVLVAKEGTGYVPPACATPVFADVPATNPFCRWIEELARRAVVSGCGGGNYCPSSAVTREQMAVFVLRTLEPALTPPDCTAPVYNDVPAGSPFCRWIEELTRRAVVSGCGGGNYCPAAPVTREQMGVFMTVTFGLALYGL
jgi:S-layer homology domain